LIINPGRDRKVVWDFPLFLSSADLIPVYAELFPRFPSTTEDQGFCAVAGRLMPGNAGRFPRDEIRVAARREKSLVIARAIDPAIRCYQIENRVKSNSCS
jgi:hypothetical protein